MTKRRNFWLRLAITAVVLLSVVFTSGSNPALRAAADGETTVLRQKTLTINVTQYKWWIFRWSDNTQLCTLFVEHENWPTGTEIYQSCGKNVYFEWANTPVCPAISEGIGTTDQCIGVYLFLVNSQPVEKTILVDLPLPSVWLSLENCPQADAQTPCPERPILLLSGEEPLPNEQIIAIHGLMNGQPFSCAGSQCPLRLPPTTQKGISLEFWADSSFGDSSQHFTAQARVVDSGVPTAPGQGGWFVDVLSSQWRGVQVATCAQLWDTFPDVGELPVWLRTPEIPQLIASEEPYQYLAGRLIAQGVVQAANCPNNGLLPNGYADACGLAAALPQVQSWQNQFDSQILTVAKESGIPGQLLKNLFAQESQFWPGIFKDPSEFGLGQITDNGAEALLLWNTSFYNQFCPFVLDASACERGYVYLSAENQALLRGALAVEAKTDCSGCEAGIDLSHANYTIPFFAQTLVANCAQVSRIVYNATGRSPGAVSDYENLWKLTVANYHIGPGCLSYAVYGAWNRQTPMDWENISTFLTPACSGVVGYVEKITR